MSRGDHVVYDYHSPRETLMVLPDAQMPLLCTHCGEELIVKLPLPLRVAAVIMREFGREHRSCKVYGPRLPRSRV